MTVLYIDADACPVKEEAARVGVRHGLRIVFVSNSWMRLPDEPGVERVIVPGGLDQADDWIAEAVVPGDVVVTGDVPLAARCVKAGADVLGSTGKPFHDVGMALAMRDLKTQLREAGQIRESGPAFSKLDRSRFLQALESMVRAARRKSAG
ncbi:YaiI/YqxD family protein [Pannonibacter sp.]|uniref:YaiI/YqxD family protein n=1 Tax=Pannonibacter sp. TaxID=1906786 RepID=UPI003F6F4F9F